ncbi:MAG: hypothetical protein N2510_00880 [Ignavibacteria bacterium]|nr:hypothetical protein [Ignavibacteria bacterium]
MLNYLRKKVPFESSPSVLVHLYYLLISFTFCYLYYHKFINRADFYSPDSSGGIYAVLEFQALKPIQFRLLVPFIFKIFQTVTGLIKPIPDKALFFILTIIFTYFILYSFYYLLNEYFKSRAMNCWLSSVIIYPMIWNFVIMNGQFFYMDFTALLVMIIGFYLIIKEKYNLLLLLFFIGIFNHPSVGYLAMAFLLYNAQRLLSFKTIAYLILMTVMYIGIYKFMDMYFTTAQGYFIIYNLPRNLSMFTELPLHIIIRDLVFNFGGLHIFLVLFALSGNWKRYSGPLLYINLVSLPYIISVLINFSIEEIRNYIVIIPFIVIPALMFLSTFENSFLKPSERLTNQ